MRPLPVQVTDEADADISMAAKWFAERSPKAALNFVDEVMASLPRVHGASLFIRRADQ